MVAKRFFSGLVAIIAIEMLAGIDGARASGLDVAWDHCGADGTVNRSFACDTNAGTDTLVVSFLSPYNFPKVGHADIRMYVCFQQNVLPDWWRVLGTGSCRLGALSVTGADPVGCASIWDPVSGSTQWISPMAGNFLYGFWFLVSVSVGDTARARDIVAGQEYELVRLVLDHSRTTGPGACAGCTTGASIGADVVWFSSTDGRNVETGGAGYVTWQDATLTCSAITPARNTTWGELKSLYR